MELAKFIKAVLEETGAIDAIDAVSGEDEIKVREALTRVVANLQARNVLQLTVPQDGDVNDDFAQPLIMLVAYDVGPAYGYARDARVKIQAEADVGDAANGPVRTQTLKKHTFL